MTTTERVTGPTMRLNWLRYEQYELEIERGKRRDCPATCVVCGQRFDSEGEGCEACDDIALEFFSEVMR